MRIAAAEAGERRAPCLIAEAVQLAGVSLGLAIDMHDPEALVIGGGLGGRDGTR